MIQEYFTPKKNQHKLIQFIKNNPKPNEVNLKIKRKLKKLNEYQHFCIFHAFIFSKPRELITKEELGHLVKYQKKCDYDIDLYFPRSNTNTSDPNTNYFLIFNNKKDFYFLVNYFLTTKEYPKQTLLTKLLVIKENIQNNFITPLRMINYNITAYAFDKKNYDNDNITIFRDLVEELEDLEEKYKEFYKQIENQINSFSGAKKGNYLLNAKCEILKKLYKLLEVDFIDIHKTSEQQFLEVLQCDWEKHDSIIYLKMDNIQFKYFFDCLEEYLKISIPFSNMEHSGNIENTNGKINASSIYSSSSAAEKKGTEPKKKETIKSIFENIK